MNYQEAYKQFNALFENELSVEEAAQFLVELYERGESFEEIAAAAGDEVTPEADRRFRR